jgi:ABC-2 type transport system permease protein
MNLRVIRAVFGKNFRGYFSSATGYVFISMFIIASAFFNFVWEDHFFADNLAHLRPLNEMMPYLLLFFVPAITMSLWAEERKQGTDELLLTLPARDIEVVLGKYFAAVAIYGVSLLFSISNVMVLRWLGSPDVGLMATTYVGYFLMGGMLIAAGMLGSLFSTNATVGFISGAVMCGLFVFPASGEVAGFGVASHVQPFSDGLIDLSGLVYFGSVTILLLYLNVVMLGRRHWHSDQQNVGFVVLLVALIGLYLYKEHWFGAHPAVLAGLWALIVLGKAVMWIARSARISRQKKFGASNRSLFAHYVVRVLALVIGVAALNVVFSTINIRVDCTQEKLHTISPTTAELLQNLPKERVIRIQAWVSPEAPREYVESRLNLLNLLNRFEAEAGGRIHVTVYETEAHSDEARTAREQFSIMPRQVATTSGGRYAQEALFLAVAVTGGPEQVVIPFFDKGIPIEYELARTVRVVSQSARKKVGFLDTGLQLFGGFDYQTGRSSPQWEIVRELQQQYHAENVDADSDYRSRIRPEKAADRLDALVVIQPSMLTPAQAERLQRWIEAGGPTLLLVDPLPIAEPKRSPQVPRGGGRSIFEQQQQPPSQEPKADPIQLLGRFGLRFNSAEIVWDAFNALPKYSDLPPEFVFVTDANGAEEPFNRTDRVTRHLENLLLLFPGNLTPHASNSQYAITPLIRSGDVGGVVQWNELIEMGYMGLSMRPVRQRFQTAAQYALAVRVKSAAGGPVNLTVVADTDFISDRFFAIRRDGVEELDFDNVSFVLNCIDDLAGDTQFIELRSRRPKHRTLTTLERETRVFEEQRLKDEITAETEAQAQLDEAQARLDRAIEEIRSRTDLDEAAKSRAIQETQAVLSRQLEVTTGQIEDEKERKIEIGRDRMEQEIREIESGIRLWSVILPPIPALLLGILVGIRRYLRERDTVGKHRLL